MPPSPYSDSMPGDPTSSPSVSVVIPALNEEENLPLVLEGLPDLVDEVIVVDGGSADDTVAVAREVRPDAVIVRQTRAGKGNALVCGFAACTGDIVVTLNADGSTDPGEIPRFVEALLAGAEVAHGSRYRGGGGAFASSRWADAGNRILNALVNVLFGTRFTDLSYGYNAFWRRLLPVLDLPAAGLPRSRRAGRIWGDGPEIQPLINIRMAAQGLRVVEVASIGYPRIHGARPQQPLRAVGRALRTVFREYLRRQRANRHVARHSNGPAESRDGRRRAQPVVAGSGRHAVAAESVTSRAGSLGRHAADTPAPLSADVHEHTRARPVWQTMVPTTATAGDRRPSGDLRVYSRRAIRDQVRRPEADASARPSRIPEPAETGAPRSAAAGAPGRPELSLIQGEGDPGATQLRPAPRQRSAVPRAWS